MSMDKAKREELILRYAPMVKNIVTRMTARLPIDSSDKESLINVGIIGLMDALDKFDTTRNVQFETYAKFRIRGAVLDELRAHDWVPRSVRDKDHKMDKALQNLKKKLKRSPTEEEIAEYLGLSLEDYHKFLTEGTALSLISASDLAPEYIDTHADSDWLQTVERGNPLDLLANEEMRERLKKAIEDLPEKERLVMSLYYYEELTMKEVGEVLRITESRVCQLHSQALFRLRSVINEGNGHGKLKTGLTKNEAKGPN
ncbi:MAG: FliA/WhiG family RNA polymerase sigma factor [Syntrophales bacterium]|nr:FliA/WhiG family RNA polymerase sigma factor [Syntrophales bacterium]